MAKGYKNMLSQKDVKILEKKYGKQRASELNWYFGDEIHTIYVVTNNLREGKKVTDKAFDKCIAYLDDVDHVLTMEELETLNKLFKLGGKL